MARKSLKCWSRKNKQNKRYVVCSNSKGQKRRRSKRLSRKKRGGSNKNSPFVGSSWSSNPGSWPGVAGVSGVSNHYPLAQHHISPPQSTNMVGGRKLQCWSRKNRQNKRYVVCSNSKGQKRRRSKRLRKRQRGGNKGSPLMPQSLVNMFRMGEFGGQSVINGAKGVQGPVSPLPTSQPELLKHGSAVINNAKISTIYNNAQQQVGGL